MKQLKFEQRKVVHYTLLIAIILLQIIAIVTWYNEAKLSESMNYLVSAGKVNRINNSMVEAQKQFSAYITNRDGKSLQDYSKSIDDISSLMDSLPAPDNSKSIKDSLIQKKKKIQAEIKTVKASIDSLIDAQINSSTDFSKEFKFKEFGTKKFLDDVKTDSYVKVDSATRKGLFSRLGDALANRTNVQKEYVNTVVTMQYKDKKMTGDIEQQLGNAIAIANNYYANEFKTLKKSFSSLRGNDFKLMQLNNQLLALTQNVTSGYDGHDLNPSAQQKMEDQYQINKTVRSYSIVLLILLMLVVSVILFNFTRMAFEYEKRLTTAQEKIRQSLNFKNRITGMISHEIRSPLSIISLYSKKATASVKEPELKETFRSIEFTTNSLLLLSNQILEYSKEENHEFTLKPRNINLEEEISQIVTSMKSLVETKGNILEATSNLKDTDTAYTDVAKMHQLFYNLIGNANKFTEKGTIKVDMNLEHLSDYEMNFKVQITDNGIGIAENDLENIFDSYYQGTVSEKVNDLGVGLGLNICKEIIELFDGEISIESKQGEGTKVTFNLVLTKE